jgi:pimeloyl-ACP methyl ester carboxylesterase
VIYPLLTWGEKERGARIRAAALPTLLLFLIPIALAIKVLARYWKPLSRWLDDVAADPFNYCQSAIGFGTTVQFRQVSTRIDGRVLEALEAAVADGCDQIHLVGHSLGGLIAVRSLTAASANHDVSPRLGQLFTIGTPLRKIQLIWPSALPRAVTESVRAWHNYRDLLDLVSSAVPTHLRTRAVFDSWFVGWGGFTASHVLYQRNGAFVAALGEACVAQPGPDRATAWGRLPELARAILTDLAVIALAVAGIFFVVTAAASA